MQLLITQFSPVACHFLPLNPASLWTSHIGTDQSHTQTPATHTITASHLTWLPAERRELRLPAVQEFFSWQKRLGPTQGARGAVAGHMKLTAHFNPLTPKDSYGGRTAPLTSKRFILYIYSINIGTEYFKHGIYCPFFLFKMQFGS